MAVLEAERSETKHAAKLDELIGYLRSRQPGIPNHRQRRIEQRYVGSGHVEKANELIVAPTKESGDAVE